MLNKTWRNLSDSVRDLFITIIIVLWVWCRSIEISYIQERPILNMKHFISSLVLLLAVYSAQARRTRALRWEYFINWYPNYGNGSRLSLKYLVWFLSLSIKIIIFLTSLKQKQLKGFTWGYWLSLILSFLYLAAICTHTSYITISHKHIKFKQEIDPKFFL